MKIIAPVSNKEIETIAAVLARGGLIVGPTDTIYGFSCLMTAKAAKRRLEQIKGRAKNKPYIILVSSYQMVRTVAKLSRSQQSAWQKLSALRPTTVILNPDDQIAVRLVKDSFNRRLIRLLKQPLVSTSVNFSGQPARRTAQEALAFCSSLPSKKQPDLFVLSNQSLAKRPSRLVDLTGAKPVIVRK